MINILMCIMIFVLAYYPEFYGVSLIHAVGIFSWLFLLINFKKLMRVISNRNILLFILVIFINSLYLFLTVMLNETKINVVFSLLYLLVLSLPISIAIVLIGKSVGKTTDDFMKMIFLVSFIQGVLAILSFKFPVIQQFFINQLLLSGYGEVFREISAFRSYGYASGLTFATPVLQSIIFVIYSMYKKQKTLFDYFCMLCILFSAIINARTSIVVVIFGMLISLIFSNKNNIYKIVGVIGGLAVAFYLYNIEPINISTNNDTFRWVIDGINEIINFIHGRNQKGYFNYLKNDRIYALPRAFKLFFGEGIRVMFGSDFNIASDIGYVNDVWLGGLIYAGSIYFNFILFILGLNSKLKHVTTSNIKISIFILVSIFLLNIKGYIFGYNSVFNILVLMFIIFELNNMSISKRNR
ncbi:hypothetical protein JDW15_05810 [Aerococcaceae bacterium zg-ZJ1578]|uniref:hypothetical protein n=1 Tax=Aerococcaceae bacterium zg-252 TaxID=2796928 RepID=UPI001A29663F|nr:hypothetical protein [Aerococcaceae bacterium zg-1578]